MVGRTRHVQCRRVEREHLLSLNPEPLDVAATEMAEQRALWPARLAALDARLRAEDPAEDAPNENGETR